MFVFDIEAFTYKYGTNTLTQRLHTSLYSTPDPSNEKWDPKKIPAPKIEFLQQRMDASWGRGKFREEVWKDKANPSNDWWEVYAPSKAEIEAAEMGYDFSNPKEWFEVSWHLTMIRTFYHHAFLHSHYSCLCLTYTIYYIPLFM